MKSWYTCLYNKEKTEITYFYIKLHLPYVIDDRIKGRGYVFLQIHTDNKINKKAVGTWDY